MDLAKDPGGNVVDLAKDSGAQANPSVDFVATSVTLKHNAWGSLMPHFDFIWELTENGNLAHISENGLTPEDVEPVVLNPDRISTSRSSGRPIAFGETPDGHYIAVVYEQIDRTTVYPIPAFIIED